MSKISKKLPATELGRKGGLKGGPARAARLDPEARKEIATRAAVARWGAVATHKGELRIGDLVIECFVLEDGRRVLSTRGVEAALGRRSGGYAYRQRAQSPHANLPIYVSDPRVAKHVTSDLLEAETDVVKFLLPGGGRGFAIEATVLPKICEVWLRARDAGDLQPNQLASAQKAEIIIRGLANVGIIALVDEATGYQYHRARTALAEILEQFLSKELARWVKRFPDEYYVQLFRLKGKDVRSLSAKKPQWMGALTKDIVYCRLAPFVLEELEKKNPRLENGRRRARHHQWLTEDVGHPRLREHIASVITLMRASPDWPTFKSMLDRALPKFDDSDSQLELDLSRTDD